MKKIFYLFFTFVALTLIMAGCSYDKTCVTILNIVNHTDAEIILIRGFEGTSETVIMPEEEIVASKIPSMCGKNTIPGPPIGGEALFNVQYTKLKVDGKIVSQEIWFAKYWDFTSEVYLATYTLNITDELIESVGFVEE